jgi:hypothetical protein
MEVGREAACNAYVQCGGNYLRAAQLLGCARSTIQHHVRAEGLHKKPLSAGKIEGVKPEIRKLPPKGKKNVYIVTSAQNNTRLHEELWDNLMALAAHDKAEVLCASFSYNQNQFGKLAVKRGTAKHENSLWFDERVEALLEASDKRIQLAPGLMWCGEMNILPTAARPLSSLQSYTGVDSGIFPHVKVAMESIATAADEPAKINYTTGTVTMRNYIQKKEGLKAEFHHVYGALIVEVEHDGTWFVRQLIADKDGSFCDLDRYVRHGKVSTGNRVKAITWGDDHDARPDEQVQAAQWFGEGNMLDELRPEHSFHHDVLSFEARDHHTIGRREWHEYFRNWCQGFDSIEDECNKMVDFLDRVRRPFTKTIVVDSNHHNFLTQWLNFEDYKRDPINALFFLEAQLHCYRFIKENPNRPLNVMRWLVERRLGQKKDLVCLDEDQSYMLMGIECGAHGDLGPDGARGTSANFAKMAHKMNRGHAHSAGIYDGVYTAGISGSLKQGYNRGPSSWTHSNIITYQNGKRAIVTLRNGRWRAN